MEQAEHPKRWVSDVDEFLQFTQASQLAEAVSASQARVVEVLRT
jgi:hypothetical protein